MTATTMDMRVMVMRVMVMAMVMTMFFTECDDDEICRYTCKNYEILIQQMMTMLVMMTVLWC